MIWSYAAPTSAAVFNPTTTPPTSLLWLTSGETIFTTAGSPSSSASSMASALVAAK
jgi:hypothetical protein